MNQNRILEKLDQISKIPEHGTEDYKQWLEQKEFLQFLLNTSIGEIPLYVSYNGTYIYSVLLPQSCLKENYVDDLMQWQCGPNSSWRYGYSSGEKGKPKSISISKPLDSDRSKLLKKATPITFSRSFVGKVGQKSYIELNQFLTHLHNLHFVEERNAYCCLNEDGDIEEVIKIHYTQGEVLVTIKQDVLDFHLFLTKSVLLRFFDRTLGNDWFGEKSRQESELHDQKNEIYARRGIAFSKEKLPTVSWLRGFQIIRNDQPRKKMIAILTGKDLEPKKYERFITSDWKHNRIAECSCDPKELGNYFVESDKPFEISPVFFKPEVLLRYKQDPEKYTINQQTISCRGSWYLQTYDINEAGQVHTYLKYLGYLPYSEQVYWKSFNEEPKAGVSERAFKTDFEGEWDLSYEPLSELKETLKKLEKEKVELWSCTNEKLFQQLNYPVTDSVKEYADEIHTLDKLVVEGLKHSYLKTLAISLKCYDKNSEEDRKLRSIKLLERVLETKGIDEHEVNDIISPLDEVHSLRTKLAGHSSGEKADKIRKDLIAKHGNLKNHFQQLVESVDKSIKALLEIIQNALFL
ncbi:MAG: hypothetical protein AB1401_07800 [Thermodesulfobacteriota bacterium]